MKKFFSFITRNWSLKLLALVLAIIVFYGVRGSLRSHHRLDTQNFMKGPVDEVPTR